MHVFLGTMVLFGALVYLTQITYQVQSRHLPLITRELLVQISGISNALKIGAGRRHTCALLADGGLQCCST